MDTTTTIRFAFCFLRFLHTAHSVILLRLGPASFKRKVLRRGSRVLASGLRSRSRVPEDGMLP